MMNRRILNLGGLLPVALLGVGAALLLSAKNLRPMPETYTAPIDQGDLLVEVAPLSSKLEAVNGAQLAHRVQIRNVSRSAVSLFMDRPTCDCTTAEIDDPFVGPGAATTARLVIDTLGHSGDFDVPIVLRAAIVGADYAAGTPKTQTVLAKVNIAIDPDSGVFPAVVDFGDVVREEGPIEKEFAFRVPRKYASPEIDALPSLSVPWLSVKLGDVGTENTAFVSNGRALVDPSQMAIASGAFGVDASIKLRDRDCETLIRFRVAGNLRSETEATPSVLYWSRNDLGRVLQMRVARHDGARVTVVGVLR